MSYADVNDEAKYYELDVTEHVRAQFGSDRIVSIILKNPTARNRKMYFHSKEKHEGAVSLQLISKPGRTYDLALPEQKSAKTEVDISGLSLSKGLYLLKVRSAATIEVLKVLVTE
ncbi:hypothetical protein FEM33_20215 [Dyadobacter flavalbus]|uniref:Carbohydrate-binding module family 96 domain-containing protein n=1 Tax=Dyadobacter flavalbus TaxID=2579942 RepID=A0A5M8QP32_9BACT|nr:hypothetical protein [Dyadobacter flavalbus]KAA6437048.1 hypothetical protein FEM33_20215 [Dyadobacter flavalbus]